MCPTHKIFRAIIAHAQTTLRVLNSYKIRCEAAHWPILSSSQLRIQRRRRILLLYKVFTMSTVMERQSRYRQMMDPGSYDGQSAGLHLSSMSQPDPSVNFGATPYQSCTLPRPSRPRGGVPATAASGSRRQILSNRVSDYLKSLNSMTRSIVLEKEYVEERHAGEWQCMDETLQEDVVDDYFMPLDVHAHYGTLPRSRCSYREPRSPSAASTSSHDQRFSFRNAWVPVSHADA